MKIAEWLFGTMSKLGEAGVDSPRRDALVLLEDTLDKDRSWVLAHPETEILSSDLPKLDALVRRRVSREPLAYIRGKAWFYGRFFEVNPSVMIPRPESEAFITLLKDLKPTKVIDVGAGSGCLAITAKLEMPDAGVTAIDISPEALEVARKNAKAHDVDIEFIQSDLFSSLKTKNYPLTTTMANLPYVPDDMITSPEIVHEPALALFSGEDGLDHYRRLWEQVEILEQRPKHILTESLQTQHSELEKLANQAGYKLQKTEQLTQLFITSRLP